MKWGCYSVKDLAVNAYLSPFVARTDAEAVRMFEQSCVDTQHMFAKSARDFHLYRIGSFDDSSGELDTFHVHLAAATSFALLELAPLERRAAAS